MYIFSDTTLWLLSLSDSPFRPHVHSSVYYFWQFMFILMTTELHFTDGEPQVQKSSAMAIKEPCYLREELESKPGLLIPTPELCAPATHTVPWPKVPSAWLCLLLSPALHTRHLSAPIFPTSLIWVLATPGIFQAHSSPNWTIPSLLYTQIFLIISPPTQSTYFLFMGINIKPAGPIFHREPFQWHLEPSKFKKLESWFSARFIIKGFTINIRIWIPPK